MLHIPDMDIYHDNGCCGCNKNRRRLLFVVIALGATIAGIVFHTGGGTGSAGGAFGVAGVFLLSALICPNGPCGMYTTDGTWGCLTVEEMTGCCGDSSAASGATAGSIADSHGSSLLGSAAGAAEPADEETGDVDPAVVANLAAIMRWYRVWNKMNGVTVAQMEAFVRTSYSDAFLSTTVSNGSVRRKADMPGAFRHIWAHGWEASDITIVSGRFDAAIYDVTIRYGPSAIPIRYRVSATFDPPGVFRSGTWVRKE